MAWMRSGLVVGLLMGCGPVAGTVGESSSDESTGRSTTQSSTTSTSSDVPPVPGTSSSESSGTRVDSSSTGEGPPSVCDPQPEDVLGGLAAVGASDEVNATCIVQSDVAMGLGRIIRLDCAGDEYQVEVTRVGSTIFGTGDVVQFRMWTSNPWWTNAYVRIDKDGELQLAAMAAEALPGDVPDLGIPPADFFAPLTHDLLADVCPPEQPDDSPCDFICPEACVRKQRQAIRFGHAGEESIVYDDTASTLGNFEILLASAVTHVEIFCTDMPSAWTMFVIAPT